MKCKFPWRQYWHGEYTHNGKRKLLPYRISDTDEVVEIPCGRCMPCRVNYGRMWSVRCVCEAKEHKENYFLTLTIDDDHVEDTLGNIGAENLEYVPTVRIDDISVFMKALRQSQQREYEIKGCRFLSCSEYGSQTFRPHYHMILFGAHIPDLKPYAKSSGYWLYTSEYLDKIWKKGEIFIGEVTADSSAYVAKYATKNTDEYRDLCKKLRVEKPSLRMSRNPGIGAHYFEEHKDQILYDRGIYIKGKLVPLPDYWLEKNENHREVELIRDEQTQRRITHKNLDSYHHIQDREEKEMLGVRKPSDEMHERSYL